MPKSPAKSDASRPIDYRVQPGGCLIGRLQVPGDKSISHRAVMLGSLAQGETQIHGLLESEDVLATLSAFRAMGVKTDRSEAGVLHIYGVGMHGLSPPSTSQDMGNSGTAMRLLAGILAGQNFPSELVGDDSLSRRPMDRVVQPLQRMGAHITSANGGCPPLKIEGAHGLTGIEYAMPVASAQVKSALLLAGMYAQGITAVTEPGPTRDHTERMLRGFGYPVDVTGRTVSLYGGGQLQACEIEIPGDFSSAAFFIVGAALAAGSDLIIEQVGLNPTRTGLLTILRKMGANLELSNQHEVQGEPVGDIRIRHGRLQGIVIPPELVANAIDEFPIIFIAAAAADGQTILTGAQELRVKESDRIAVMARGLSKLGVETKESADGIVIHGGRIHGGTVESNGDHRVAMAFAMAGLVSQDVITVHDCTNVATSFPDFVQSAEHAGLRIHMTKGRA